MKKNCIATYKSALSVCESNAKLLPSGHNTTYWVDGKEFALHTCKKDYDSCESTCKN